MDKAVVIELLSTLINRGKIYKNVYIFNITQLLAINPIVWRDGALLEHLGYSVDEDGDDMLSIISNVIMERCVDIVLCGYIMDFYLQHPATFKEELIYYFNETYKLTNLTKNNTADIIITDYIELFSRCVNKLLNNTVNIEYNIFNIPNYLDIDNIVDGMFSVVDCVIDVREKIPSVLVIDKYYKSVKIP